MRWMSIHFPKWQVCHWKLVGENQYNFLEVYIASECIYPPTSPWQRESLYERLWRRDVCCPGSAKSFKPARRGRQGREVRQALRGAGSWHGDLSNSTKPLEGLLWSQVFRGFTLATISLPANSQCPWQGSTNNNWTTANVITSHSPFPAEPGTQNFNTTGGKGTFLTQCEYNRNMSRYF